MSKSGKRKQCLQDERLHVVNFEDSKNVMLAGT